MNPFSLFQSLCRLWLWCVAWVTCRSWPLWWQPAPGQTWPVWWRMTAPLLTLPACPSSHQVSPKTASPETRVSGVLALQKHIFLVPVHSLFTCLDLKQSGTAMSGFGLWLTVPLSCSPIFTEVPPLKPAESPIFSECHKSRKVARKGPHSVSWRCGHFVGLLHRQIVFSPSVAFETVPVLVWQWPFLTVALSCPFR